MVYTILDFTPILKLGLAFEQYITHLHIHATPIASHMATYRGGLFSQLAVPTLHNPNHGFLSHEISNHSG